MKTISILVLQNSVLASIADARYVFTMVNQFLEQSGKEPLFKIQLAANAKQISLNDGLFLVQPDLMVRDIKHHDLIIIPALMGDMMSATHVNRHYAHWLAQQ